MGRLQNVLSADEMSVAGECIFICMDQLKKERESRKANGDFTEKDEKIYEAKFNQMENVWRKIIKGYAAQLTGMIVQPVFED